jgi:hypothetical protein
MLLHEALLDWLLALEALDITEVLGAVWLTVPKRDDEAGVGAAAGAGAAGAGAGVGAALRVGTKLLDLMNGLGTGIKGFESADKLS